MKLKDWLANTLKDECKEDAIAILENGVEEVSKMTPGFIQYRERELNEAREQAREQGLQQGREQGIEQTKIETAKAFLDILDDKEIAERVKLPIEVVKELRKQNLVL